VRALDFADRDPTVARMDQTDFDALMGKVFDGARGTRRVTCISRSTIPNISDDGTFEDPATAHTVAQRMKAEVPLSRYAILGEAAPEHPCVACGAQHWVRCPGENCVILGLSSFQNALCHDWQCGTCKAVERYDGRCDAILNQATGYKYTYELLMTYCNDMVTTKECKFYSFW
jgi:hypothetical protein